MVVPLGSTSINMAYIGPTSIEIVTTWSFRVRDLGVGLRM